MDRKQIKTLLTEYDETKVNTFIEYVEHLGWATNKKKERIALFIDKKSNQWLAKAFMKVDAEGLAFDGKHVTLQSRGISYDYIAYKNKVLNMYPESIFDIQAVYSDDEFSFKKESGKVVYTHVIKNPFNTARKDSDIIGAYCVVKNSRGEFLTTLNSADIQKHRAKATSDNIWREWFLDMVLKTVIRKACKIHFDDIVGGMLVEEEKETDLDAPVDIDIEVKAKIEQINTVEGLMQFYKDNKTSPNITKLLTKRKLELQNANS